MYYQHYDYIKKLKSADKAKLLDAIFDYAITGTIPVFDGSLEIVFEVIKTQIDITDAHYKTTCAKNAETAKVREANRRRMREAAEAAAAAEAVKIANEGKEDEPSSIIDKNCFNHDDIPDAFRD